MTYSDLEVFQSLYSSQIANKHNPLQFNLRERMSGKMDNERFDFAYIYDEF
mgnify:CR=1 FL=1